MDWKAEQDRRKVLATALLARRSATDAQARSVATSNTVASLAAQVRQLQLSLAQRDQAIAALAARVKALEDLSGEMPSG